MKKFLSTSIIVCLAVSLHAGNPIKIVNNIIVMDSLEILNTTQLDLSNKHLKRLPKNIGLFTSLVAIDLSSNKLENVDGLNKCKLLTYIDLSRNPKIDLKESSGELSQLGKLTNLDLRNCDLIYVPKELFKCKSLEYLNLDNNFIQVLPNELGNLSNLSELTIANNELRSIKSGVKNLKSLKKLNISNNNLSSRGGLLYELSMLKKLEVLEIDYNIVANSFTNKKEGFLGIMNIKANFNVNTLILYHVYPVEEYSHFQQFKKLENIEMTVEGKVNYLNLFTEFRELKNLHSLSINDHLVKSFPPTIGQMSGLKKFEFIGASFQEFPISFSNLENLKYLSISNCDSINSDLLWRRVGELKSLEEIKVLGCKLNAINPAYLTTSKLNTLDLSRNILEYIPEELSDLEQLKLLILLDNPLNLSSVDQLKIQNGELEIVHNSIRRKIDDVVIPPLPSVNVPYMTRNVDVNQRSELTLSSGTNVQIPSDAFLYSNGKPVQGEVEVKFREFRDPVDMVFAGIPMSFEEEGEIIAFKSAGMIEFDAFQNGERLQLNPYKDVVVNIASEKSGDEYDLYKLNEDNGEWEVIGKDSIYMPDSTNSVLAESFEELNLSEEYPEYPYFKESVKLVYEYSKNNKKAWISVYPYHSGYTENRGNYSKRNTENKVFSDIKELQKVDWLIDVTDKKELSLIKDSVESIIEMIGDYIRLRNTNNNYNRDSLQKELYNTGNGEAVIDDLWLELNRNSDNIYMCVSVNKSTWKIPVTPDVGNKRPEVVQRRFEQVYTKYNKARSERMDDWKVIDSSSADYLEDYEEKLVEYQKAYREYRSTMLTYNKDRFVNSNADSLASNEDNIYRSFGLTNMGYFNCDIEGRMVMPKQLLAEIKPIGVKGVRANRIYIIDKTMNGVISYDMNKSKRFDAASNNAAIVILSKGHVGVISPDRFDWKVLSKSTNEIEIEALDMKKYSLLDIRLAAGSL